MKVAILAGGSGSRFIEETVVKPKAMVEIDGRPILWHIMMYYSYFGFKEFVIALGYKGEIIKRWMQKSHTFRGDTTAKSAIGVDIFRNVKYDWVVHLVDTGQKTQTGGRIKRLAPWLNDKTFMLTWCDGLSDVDLNALRLFHQSHNRIATLTAVLPPSRFGHLILDGNKVVHFNEKPRMTRNWINGAFFVLESEVFDYIEGDYTQWEKEPLERLVRDEQLMAYRHTGFWQCMDTLHEKRVLESLWKKGEAPWKKWKN